MSSFTKAKEDGDTSKWVAEVGYCLVTGDSSSCVDKGQGAISQVHENFDIKYFLNH
jgi:hypothetical protein